MTVHELALELLPVIASLLIAQVNRRRSRKREAREERQHAIDGLEANLRAALRRLERL